MDKNTWIWRFAPLGFVPNTFRKEEETLRKLREALKFLFIYLNGKL